MNDFLIEHFLTIVQTGTSEIAKINALKELGKYPTELEAYLKKQQAQSKKAEAKKSTPSLTAAEKALLGIQ
ncbi:hypothetical protein [Vibrio fluvialis]|uniref:hypothetical protein n=1 Tax=Vibrio fluvialis TaxID=676 RepID=UPI001BB0297D|nr:hypothetical protein [Vibrio fluvialis]QUF70046.1 hypothetical protein KC397_06540 [Vibrio fluvialis]